MSTPPHRPAVPPPSHQHHHLLNKTTPLADIILTSFSLFLLFSSPPKTTPVIYHPNNIISFPWNLRRFLKIPTMSSPSQKPINPSHRLFATPQSLSDWLKPRLPPDSFASWGVKPGTKNIHNLWLEISEGETSLADSTPPVRTVEVVVVRIIRDDGKVLVESHQELSNGDLRRRCRPLSEKMKRDESVEAAVNRAVKEELGSIIKIGDFEKFDSNDDGINGIVKIIPNSYVKKVEERASASYPGLPACYVVHKVDAKVESLPDGEFCTDEVDEYGGLDAANASFAENAVRCKKHYWKWLNSDSV